jgi:hypothetical protein
MVSSLLHVDSSQSLAGRQGLLPAQRRGKIGEAQTTPTNGAAPEAPAENPG